MKLAKLFRIRSEEVVNLKATATRNKIAELIPEAIESVKKFIERATERGLTETVFESMYSTNYYYAKFGLDVDWRLVHEGIVNGVKEWLISEGFRVDVRYETRYTIREDLTGYVLKIYW